METSRDPEPRRGIAPETVGDRARARLVGEAPSPAMPRRVFFMQGFGALAAGFVAQGGDRELTPVRRDVDLAGWILRPEDF